jgi:hypothetical protein
VEHRPAHRESAIVWLAVLCAAAWVCLSGMDAPAHLAGGAAFALAGLVAAWVYAGSDARRPAPLPLGLYAIAGVAGSALLSGPWRWTWAGLAACSVALLPTGAFLLRARRSVWTLARGLVLVGSALLLTQPLWARWHTLPGMSYLTWPLVRLCGAKAAIFGTSVRVAGSPCATTFTPSPQHMVLDFAVLALVGLIVLGAPWRLLWRFAVATVVWLLLRYVTLVLLTAQTSDHSVFWHPLWVAVSLVPIAPLTSWLTQGVAHKADGAPNEELKSSRLRRLLPSLAGGLCLGVALLFADPGHQKAGRLLIDESHGPWESTEVPMDTGTLTPLSSYNYYSFGKWIGDHYDLRKHRDGPLDERVLSQCDVLMLKVPTRSFAERELVAIERFARQGGGLWMIGDHTNVFGTATDLNPLARMFGIEFEADATYDLETTGLPTWRPPPYPVHPIVRHIDHGFLIHTSCTLQSMSGKGVMTVRALRVAEADYSRTHFFPSDRAKTTEFGFGPYPICVASHHGAGRVVAFADSTVWSNYLCFMPGKPELALGTLSWLNRSNRLAFVPLVAALVAVLFLTVALLLNRPIWPASGEPMLAAWCAGAFIAGLACVQVNQAAYPTLQHEEKAADVCFEGQYSDIFLPIDSYRDRTGRADRDSRTFYVWTQRLGLVPAYEQRLRWALKRANAVVLINPSTAPSADDGAALARFVRDGGRLLVVVGRSNRPLDRESASKANAILAPFNLRVEGRPPVHEAEVRFGEGERCPAFVSATVHGGQPLASLADGHVVAARQQVGEGAVVACAVGGLLTTRALGMPTDQLIADQRANARFAFMLMRSLKSADAEEAHHAR